MNELQTLRLSHSIPARDIAETVQQLYPRFDRYLLSKCEAESVYGIQLKTDALKALYTKFDPDGWKKRRKKDGHRNQFRIYCRMDEVTYKALTEKISADGFKTVQDWLLDQVLNYIEGGKSNAVDPG